MSFNLLREPFSFTVTSSYQDKENIFFNLATWWHVFMIRLIFHPDLTIGVNVSVNGSTVRGVNLPSPDEPWDSLLRRCSPESNIKQQIKKVQKCF